MYWDTSKTEGLSLFDAKEFIVPYGESFTSPSPLRAGQIFVMTADDGSCLGSGALVTLCRWDGSIWAPIGGSGGGGAVAGWPAVNVAGGITWANSFANAARFGKDTSNYWALYHDVTDGLQLLCVVAGVQNDCNYIRKLAAGKEWGIQDASGGNVFRIVPSAGTPKGRYPFYSGYYPLKSVYLNAQFWRGDGTNCPSTPTLVTISNMPEYSYVCTENNSSRMRARLPMPPNWDGGAIYVQPHYSQTAADTGSVLLDVAAACRAFGTAFNGTYGTEANVDDSVLAGSGAIEATLSGAITPNGTCAPGDNVFIYVDVDATSNPTTAAATLNFLGGRVFWSETSLSH
jgi:hypothetical protein